MRYRDIGASLATLAISAGLGVAVLIGGCGPAVAQAQKTQKTQLSKAAAKAAPEPVEAVKPAAFVAPPRSVGDITAMLENEKPDPGKVAKLVAVAEATPPTNLDAHDLAEWYYNRAQARFELGRARDSVADAEMAVKLGQGDDYLEAVSRYEIFLARRLRNLGEPKRALEIINKQVALFANRNKGRLFNLNLQLANHYWIAGDINRAEQHVARMRALFNEGRANWRNFDEYRVFYLSQIEEGSAYVAEARGQFVTAEAAYRRSAAHNAELMRKAVREDATASVSGYERAIDYATAWEGRVKVKQGRVAEGEGDVRRALLSRLSKSGKYSIDTASVLGVLVFLMQEQGRYKEAEQLEEHVIDIYRGLGYPQDSTQIVNSLNRLAQIYNSQRRYAEAVGMFDKIDALTASWEPVRREAMATGLTRVSILLSSGQAANAQEVARRSLERTRQRYGEKSVTTAVAQGFYGAALARDGKTAEALAAFRESIPVLLSSSQSVDDESGAAAAAQESRVRFIIESYLRLRSAEAAKPETARETFIYADIVRGQAVQRALQASSSRSAVRDPALAQLVRGEQDLNKQIGAAAGALNNLLAQPAGERDDKAVKDVQAQIVKLQAAHLKVKQDITKRFPSYGDLVNPAPPTTNDIQASLAPNEAMLSFYFGRTDGFVWVLRRDRAPVMARLRVSLGQLNERVNKLRQALEPQAAMVSDIPAFDMKEAYRLYADLLKPVEAAWKDASDLIVVTNGALGLLPLSLLPTAPAEVAGGDEPLFESYRKVAWLARTHAVTMVPSASALRTLRQSPPGKPGRGDLIAFGDPIFSKEQADEVAKPVQTADAGAANVMRGLPLKRRNSPQLDDAKSAQLAQLPRLPDTADELKSIAVALQADPDKVLNLGKDANEKKVKGTDLSGFKIVAFATHGLVPGELDGLSQPALALSAPGVADSDGDGLLTMEEILALKLDADWVVLSACNTGAGSGAGAEAASGLGRAFFYAGTRALLVTNWSVHSQSARELVTDLFKRQADDPKLTRGEALRQAMVALMDGPGFVDDESKTQFTYAHPLFWAPYTIIGDGGRR